TSKRFNRLNASRDFIVRYPSTFSDLERRISISVHNPALRSLPEPAPTLLPPDLGQEALRGGKP
ncbi:MAG: hypothetical protein WB713_15030, partial [Methyloceanibacter sp.]